MYAVDVAIFNKLKADATVAGYVGGTASPRIYNGIASQKAPLPVVVFQQQAGGHVPDSPRENVELLYLVKAISGSVKNAKLIDKAISDAIDRADLSVGNGYADYATFRMSHIHYAEDLGGGSIIYHIGALYNIKLSSS